MKKVLTIIALLASTMNALWAAEAYVVKSTDGKTLTFYHDDNKATREGTVYGMNDNWGSWNINITHSHMLDQQLRSHGFLGVIIYNV